MASKRAVLIIAVVSMILGSIISIQFRSNIRSPQYSSPDRWSELTVQIDYLRKQHDALASEAILLGDKVLLSDTGSRAKALQDELSKLSVSAGMTPVEGQGIIVDLNSDSNLGLGSEENSSNEFLVEDLTPLFIVNELRAAGAEAISINNERIVAASGFHASDAKIYVNNQLIESPFEIRAIGNAETLYSSLNMKGGELEVLNLCGIKTSVQKEMNVHIPAFKAQFP